MGPGFGAGIGELIGGLFIALAIFVPLGVWKLIEIVIWIFTHISFTVTP